jgi:hypothetical protein
MFDITSKQEYYMNTFGIKPLANYEQALAHYNSVAPIRGKTVRPLGIRRHHGSASISLDEATGDVKLNYHIYPLVVWHKAGGFTVHAPHHYSGFIVHTLHNYLPDPMFFQWDKSRLVVKMDTVRTIYDPSKDENDGMFTREGAEGNRFLLEKHGSLKFIKRSYGYDLESYPKEYNYRKRPRAAKKIMAKYQPFLDWVALVTSIDNKGSEFEDETTTAHNRLRVACGYRPSEWYDDQYRKVYSHISYEDPVRMKFNYDMTVLDDIPLSRKSHRQGRGWSHNQSAERLLEWMSGTEPTEDWSWAMYVLLRQGGTHEHQYPHGQSPIYKRSFKGDDLTNYIEDLICVVHADEVFIEEQLEVGVVPSKSNRFYITEPNLSEQTDTVSVSST